LIVGVIIFSSLLLNWRFASAVGGLSLAAIWYFAILEKQGARVINVDDPINYARDLSVIIILVGILIYLLITSWSRTLQSARVELQERLRVEEKLQRQADYLAALNATALGLLSRSELQPLLESILARACDLLNTRHGLIELVLPDGSALRQDVGHGVLSKYNGAFTSKNEGVTGSVWASGQPLVVHDYRNWNKSQPEFVDAGFYAVMGVPLKVGDTAIGVLAVSYVEQERTFTAEQINGWLATQLRDSGQGDADGSERTDLAAADVREPRVAISPGVITLGFKTTQSGVDTVVSVDAVVFLTESGDVAVKLVIVRAGALLLPLGIVADELSAACERMSLPVLWSENDAQPVAMIRVGSLADARDARWSIDALELTEGEVFVAGHTEVQTANAKRNRSE
jgi:hypothetical protein